MLCMFTATLINMVLFFSSCGVCAPHAQDGETSQHSQENALPIFDVVSHPPSQENRDPAPVDESVDSAAAALKPAEKSGVQPVVLEEATPKESSASDSVKAKPSSPAGGRTSAASPRRNWRNVSSRWVAQCSRTRLDYIACRRHGTGQDEATALLAAD